MNGGCAEGVGPAGDHRDQHAIYVSGVLIPMVTRRTRLATPGCRRSWIAVIRVIRVPSK
jgi:hypothetical protein